MKQQQPITKCKEESTDEKKKKKKKISSTKQNIQSHISNEIAKLYRAINNMQRNFLVNVKSKQKKKEK